MAGAGAVRDGVQRDPEALRRLLVAADGVLGDLGEVDLGVVDAEVGAVHPREVEQVLDEPLEPAASAATVAAASRGSIAPSSTASA